MKVERSLRQRALATLARREHSRVELARKLAPHAADDAELDRLLDDLERERLLSGERFAESLVHRRSARFGSTRIEHELGQHGLASTDIADHVAALRASEQERCLAVWQKKFGSPARDARERARQGRFLLARGFPAAVVRQILQTSAQASPGDTD